MGFNQMKLTAQMIEKENHPLIEKQLKSMAYTKEAINNFKAQLNKLVKFYVKCKSIMFILKLLQNKNQFLKSNFNSKLGYSKP
jgi:hypothetical protein